MFSTRRTGAVYTSVRLHPFKLLLAALALITIGCAMLNDHTFLWFGPGLLAVAAGIWLICVSIRQMVRGGRTFLS